MSRQPEGRRSLEVVDLDGPPTLVSADGREVADGIQGKSGEARAGSTGHRCHRPPRAGGDGGEVSDAVLGRELPLPVGGASAVVVDLDGLTLLDRDVVCRLLTRLQAVLASSGARMMVVCRRSTARSLLRAWHLHERMAIYPTLDAALG